jgi:hypothetical protein
MRSIKKGKVVDEKEKRKEEGWDFQDGSSGPEILRISSPQIFAKDLRSRAPGCPLENFPGHFCRRAGNSRGRGGNSG